MRNQPRGPAVDHPPRRHPEPEDTSDEYIIQSSGHRIVPTTRLDWGRSVAAGAARNGLSRSQTVFPGLSCRLDVLDRYHCRFTRTADAAAHDRRWLGFRDPARARSSDATPADHGAALYPRHSRLTFDLRM